MRRIGAALFTTLALIAVSSAAQADVAALRETLAKHAGLDLDADGTPEIEALRLDMDLGAEAAAREHPGGRLLLVVCEERLLSPLPADAGEAPDLRPHLARYLGDLAAAGWRPRLVVARVYSGPRHQDGKTLLALRRALRAVRALEPSFAGAVLIGSFPEAYLVRSYNWRKHGPITLRKGAPDERRFAEAVPYLRTVPEVVAVRAEIVLADLDGRWEERYVEPRERLPTLHAVFEAGVPARGGITPHLEMGSVTYEDFFLVDDGHFATREVLGASGERTGFDVAILDDHENDECGPEDGARPNPMARPDIGVSRIDARHVALRPRRDVKGEDGAGLLDGAGRPREVRFARPEDAPAWIGVWERDPALERVLLAEYLERNHRFRAGAFADAFRPIAIAKDLGSGWDAARRARPEWSGLELEAPFRGHGASLLDVVRWLKTPAVLRDLRAHTDPYGAVFGKADTGALTDAAGGTPWSWSPGRGVLTPSLHQATRGGKLDFALLRTLWANGALPDAASIWLHTGCDSISPANAGHVSYDDPRYGYWQGGEALLFYAGGLALVGRAKVFYDAPRGFYEALAEGLTVGDAWARYYEVESAATAPGQVGGGIGRKRAYFWSVLGDWTLRLEPAQRDASHLGGF